MSNQPGGLRNIQMPVQKRKSLSAHRPQPLAAQSWGLAPGLLVIENLFLRTIPRPAESRMRIVAGFCILLNVLVLGLFAVRRIEVVVMEIQVILADANPGVRAALRSALEQCSAYRVVAEAVDANHLLAYAARDCPDLLILDPDLPGIAAITMEEMVKLLEWLCPDASRVMLDTCPGLWAMQVKAIFDLGVYQTDPPHDLLAHLDHAALNKNLDEPSLVVTG
jgi:hypothetical protein